MKTSIKTFASLIVLAFFLLIGWATSVDEDYDFVDIYIQNDSDSCTVTDVSMVYHVNRSNDDTLIWSGSELAPGDTIIETWERVKFKKLNYTCNCPNDTFLHAEEVAFDTAYYYYKEIMVACD